MSHDRQTGVVASPCLGASISSSSPAPGLPARAGPSLPANHSPSDIVANRVFPLHQLDRDFENSDNVTHLLVADFTGSNGQDLDTDDDGVLDATPWSEEVDCLALVESPGGGDRIYCATTVGPDGFFVPAHVFLCDDGWRIGGFGLDATDTPGVENLCIAGAFEIYEIQGAGLASPLAGLLVTTEDNVVTGVASNGFFMQTPQVRTDGDPATSDSIFVFTGGAPRVSTGDRVDVTGTGLRAGRVGREGGATRHRPCHPLRTCLRKSVGPASPQSLR